MVEVTSTLIYGGLSCLQTLRRRITESHSERVLMLSATMASHGYVFPGRLPVTILSVLRARRAHSFATAWRGVPILGDHQSSILVSPRTRAYSTGAARRLGSVPTSSSQSFSQSVDRQNASTRPASSQCKTWAHVSISLSQLGQRGSCPSV